MSPRPWAKGPGDELEHPDRGRLLALGDFGKGVLEAGLHRRLQLLPEFLAALREDHTHNPTVLRVVLSVRQPLLDQLVDHPRRRAPRHPDGLAERVLREQSPLGGSNIRV